MVGTPMFIDDATANIDCVDYTGCCVEVSATNVLPKSVKLYFPSDKLVEQSIEYEWLPARCTKCLSFGHHDSCPRVALWVAKLAIDIGVGASSELNLSSHAAD